MVEEEEKKKKLMMMMSNIKCQRPSREASASQDLVGLRILIKCSTKRANIVAKSSLKSCLGVSPPKVASPVAFPELTFLKACYFCKKELSPKKDVYIYGGDKGFCSKECRCEQILLDERKEFEILARQRIAAKHRLRTGARRAPEASVRWNVSAAA